MFKYQSTKQFGHDLGISCAFRQWRATHSHCSKIHGYALAIKLTFGANELDHRNWVMDFGGFKEIKSIIMDTFDHKLVVANDDPMKEHFKELHEAQIADVVFVNDVGCERFAEQLYHMVKSVLRRELKDRVNLISVEVHEHGANSAIYTGEI